MADESVTLSWHAAYISFFPLNSIIVIVKIHNISRSIWQTGHSVEFNMALISLSFITKQLVVHKLCYYFYLDMALLFTHCIFFKGANLWSRSCEVGEINE